jgi:hypothetical protein
MSNGYYCIIEAFESLHGSLVFVNLNQASRQSESTASATVKLKRRLFVPLTCAMNPATRGSRPNNRIEKSQMHDKDNV